MKAIIKKKHLTMICCLVLLVPPEGILSSAGMIVAMISMAASAYLIIKKFKGFTLNTVFIIAFIAAQSVATIINEGNVVSWGRDALRLFALYTYISYYMSRDSRTLFESLFVLFYAYVIIEMVTSFFDVHLLRSNNMVYMYYPLIATLPVVLYHNHLKKKYIRWFWCMQILLILYVMIYGIIFNQGDLEATFLISVMIMCAYVLFGGVLAKIKMRYLFIAIVLLNLGIVFFQFLLNSDFMEDILVSVFKKDVSLTGRTALWQRGVLEMLERPWLGYGSSWAGLSIWGGRFTPHNQYLYIMILGGNITFSALFIILLRACKNIDGQTIGKRGPDAVSAIKYGLVSSLVSFVALSYSYDLMMPWFILLIIALNYKQTLCDMRMVRKLNKRL